MKCTQCADDRAFGKEELCQRCRIDNNDERGIGHVRAHANKRLREIEADGRFHYPPAPVEVNAPLALIQAGLYAEHRALNDVVDILNSS